MARDDYHVIAARILAYLYACLKEGEKPDHEYLEYLKESLSVTQSYWDYILLTLSEEEYIKGVTALRVAGLTDPVAKIGDLSITPKGIEYMENNTTIAKAKRFLKDLKEMIPGL